MIFISRKKERSASIENVVEIVDEIKQHPSKL